MHLSVRTYSEAQTGHGEGRLEENADTGKSLQQAKPLTCGIGR